MKLRTRTVATIIATEILFIAGLYAVSQFLLIDGFAKLEMREASANLERVQNTINQEMEFMAAKTVDWAAWQDTYDYANDKNKTYEEANLMEDTAANVAVNFMIFYNAKGELLNAIGWDLEADKAMKVDEYLSKTLFTTDNYFLKHKNEEEIKKNIVSTPKGPAMVTSHPIVTAEKKGPIRGTLVFVKYITPSMIENFSTVTKFPLEKMNWDTLAKGNLSTDWKPVSDLNEKNVSKVLPTSPEFLTGFQVFNDFLGKPSFALKIKFNRDVMHQGHATIKTFIYSIIAFGVFFTLALVGLIERTVVSRVLKLSNKVENIGKNGNNERVPVEGKDEITYLSRSINGMLDSLAEKSRAIETIMDNVNFGLLRCDRNGNILPGFSQSCWNLLDSKQSNNLIGTPIWGALELSDRDAENFANLYEQVALDSLLAEDLVQQLPSRFNQGERTLSLFGSVICDEAGEVESVLFTVANITALANAEKENELNQALLKILQSKERFVDLVTRVMNSSDKNSNLVSLLGANAKPEQSLILAKRNLHTWKGDFSVFGLREIASEIHEIEENANDIDRVQSGIQALGNNLNQFLKLHDELLGLNENTLNNKNFEISESTLKELHNKIQKNPESSLKIVEEFIRETTFVEANRLFNHITNSTVELAQRLGKDVTVVVNGGDVKLPMDYSEVYNSLIHLFRNAVDHGLECPADRGEKDKKGLIKVDFKQKNQNYEIEISDDGAGINLDAIKVRGIKAGLIRPEDWEKMSDEEKVMIIFETGFSTRDEVTLTSGRGIGLDVVKNAVKSTGGDLKVTSLKGRGTQFHISLPKKAA